jgi:hypothetical protein
MEELGLPQDMGFLAALKVLTDSGGFKHLGRIPDHSEGTLYNPTVIIEDSGTRNNIEGTLSDSDAVLGDSGIGNDLEKLHNNRKSTPNDFTGTLEDLGIRNDMEGSPPIQIPFW